jgi:hypothetical protein
MASSEQKPPRQPSSRSLWYWISGIALLAIVVITVTGSILASRAEPILRARVIETLSARFKSQVELDSFHVSVRNGLQVSGGGLRIFGDTDPNNHEQGMQPIIGVAEFRFRTGIPDLLRSPMHVDTVYVTGLQINLPPKEHRGEMKRLSPRGGKIRIVVDRLVCDRAQLIINTLKPGKLPLEFEIENLKMTSVGPGSPMHFEANLTNPKPLGNILSSGSFGPWDADSPRDTPVSGAYSFNHADLGTIKGIGGILSSTGKYAGTLDHIVVDGVTDTPDFRIAISGRPVPLHTDFHAIVDGTNGDTYLQPVRARLLDSSLTANGSVVRTDNPRGHHVELEVAIEQGKIEDLLKLAIRTDPPIMTGAVRLKTHFDLPPGEPDVANRLKLSGDFQVSGVHFTNEKVQGKVDSLSMRSQGRPKLALDNIPDNVPSKLTGTFSLIQALISFSRLQFQVPGTEVHLTGQYSLDGNQFDFRGTARMDARLSHMVTGWKSVLLKPVDPFFSKNGSGTEIPIKVTGTKSEPHFGTDFGHKDKNKSGKDKDPRAE